MEEQLIRLRHKSGAKEEISMKQFQEGEQFVRRTCDYCKETMELTNKPLTPADADAIASWVVLVRVFLVNQQTYPVQMHACKDSCAKNIIELGMLKLPKEITDMLEEQKRLETEAKNNLAKQIAQKEGAQFVGDRPLAPVAEA